MHKIYQETVAALGSRNVTGHQEAPAGAPVTEQEITRERGEGI
jgi:hypothetical protein